MKDDDPGVWVRTRGWLFFNVDGLPDGADAIAGVAKRMYELFTKGGNLFVVIRGDVVEGNDYNLVVPLDAARDYWDDAVKIVATAIGGQLMAQARVKAYHPAIPHQAHCFITQEDFRGYPLHEYSPPGRHPQSPGANPWG
jgi:hypothetical protein